jgi:hypothetical protein
MSSESMAVDLGKSAGELGGALNSVRKMRGQWNEILWESTVFGLKVGISVSSYWKENNKIRRFFDEEATDEPIADPAKKLF